jgi:hypothetical protein
MASRSFTLALLGAALTAASLAPGRAEATITIGSDLSGPASMQKALCGTYATSCTSVLMRTKPGNLHPAASPADGTVVGFGVKSGAAGTLTFRLLRLDSPIASKVLLLGGVGTGPTVDLPGAGTFDFGANLSIKAGDWIGIDSASSNAYETCQGGAETWRLSPPVAEGTYMAPTQSSDVCELLVDAVIEPSASVGFGGGKVTRSGRALLTLRMPGPGVLALGGPEIRTADREVAAAGPINIAVFLRGDARKRLQMSGHVRVKVSETFTPTGGGAASESRTVNFKGGTR